MSTPKPDGFADDPIVGGVVSAGSPVVGATVTPFVDFGRTKQAGDSTITDEDGRYQLAIDAFRKGPAWVCSSGGIFQDPSTAVTATPSKPWCKAVYPDEDRSQVVNLSPLLRQGEALARSPRGGAYQASSLATIHDAMKSSATDIDAFFACAYGHISIADVAPADPTVPDEVSEALTPEKVAGVILAGFSAQAKLICQHMDKTPGLVLNGVSLAEDYAEDLQADGFYDGFGEDGAIEPIDGFSLDDLSLRTGNTSLPQGIRHFLLSDRNATGLQPSDLTELLVCMARAGTNFSVFKTDGGELDESPAHVAWRDVESRTTVVQGHASFTCEAQDASGIRSLEAYIVLPDGTHLGSSFFDEHDVQHSGQYAQVTVTLDSTLLGDDDYSLYCRAVDGVGLQSTDDIELVINNKPANVSVLEPNDTPDALSGEVTIGCSCSELQGGACELLSPPPDSPQMQCSPFDAQNGELWCRWQSDAAPDGPVSFTCQATSPGLDPVSDTIVRHLDNRPFGKYSGTVWMENPVADAIVQAVAYDGDCDADNNEVVSVCDEPCRTNSAGYFELPLSDNYVGPLCIRALSPQDTSATYIDGWTRQPIALQPDDDVITFVASYTPGQQLSQDSLSGLTALATSRADSVNSLPGQMEADFQDSTGLLGELLRAGEPIDITSTIPVDLFDRVVTGLGAREILSLVHNGFSRMGVEICMKNGLSPTCLPSITWLRQLRRDCTPVCDGFDAAGQRIYMLPGNVEPLDAYTLRYKLAESIYSFVRATPVGEEPTPNRQIRGITAADISLSGGLSDSLSLNDGPLFPPHKDPIQFDRTSGSVVFHSPAPEQGFSGYLELDVLCLDNVAVRRCDIIAPSFLVGIDQDASPEHIINSYASTEDILPGRFELIVEIEDTSGNIAHNSQFFYIDRTGPMLVLRSHDDGQLVPDLNVELEFEASDFSGVQRVVVDGVVATQSDETGLWEASITLQHESQTLVASATDTLGNASSSLAFTLRYDDEDPTITPISPVPAIAGKFVTLHFEANDNHGTPILTLTAPAYLSELDEDPAPNVVLIREVPTSGPHMDVGLSATDDAGRSASLLYRVLVDTDAPIVSVESHTSGQWVADSKVVLSGRVADAHAVTSLTVNGHGVVLTPLGDGQWSWTQNITLPQPGDNAIVLLATDALGNQSSAESLPFTLRWDAEPPSLAITSPQEGEIITENITVIASIQDNIAATEIRVSAPDSLAGRDSDSDPATVHLVAAASEVAIEGPATIVVQGNDHVGHIGTQSRNVIFDTLPPSLDIFGESMVRSTGYRLNWQDLRDSATQVIELKISWGSVGQETQEKVIANPQESGYTDLVFDSCSVGTRIIATAWDRAGRSATDQLIVDCDNTPPAIARSSSVYYEERRENVTVSNAGDIIYSTDSAVDLGAADLPMTEAKPAVLYKSLFRSDDWSENVPYLDFAISDAYLDPYSPQYRVLFREAGDSEIVERRPWSTLPRQGSNYRIRFSYQSLLPEGATPEENYIARSGMRDLNIVEVRATDQAGNATVERFAFRFYWMAEPCVLSSCELAPAPRSSTLSPPRLHTFYRGDYVEVVEATLQCGIAIEPDSLSPRVPISIELSGGTTASRITKVAYGVEYLSDWTGNPELIGNWTRCSTPRHRAPDGSCVDGREIVCPLPGFTTSDGGCLFGSKREAMEESIPRNEEVLPDTAPYKTVHSREFNIPEAEPSEDGGFNVPVGEPVRATIALPSLELTAMGAPFDWTVRDFDLPHRGSFTGYTAYTAGAETGKDVRWVENDYWQERHWRVSSVLTGLNLTITPISGSANHADVHQSYQFRWTPLGMRRFAIPNVEFTPVGSCAPHEGSYIVDNDFD